jgi:hypothetical protein
MGRLRRHWASILVAVAALLLGGTTGVVVGSTDAQPIVTVGYHERIPPLETGVPGLVLANTTQVYPEDRGTNYAVELGQRAASLVGASVSTASTA